MLWQEGGRRALWAGLSPTLVRAFPANACQWLAWEVAMRQLLPAAVEEGGSSSGSSGGGGGGQDMAVSRGQGHDQAGDILRQLVRIGRGVRQQDGPHPGDGGNGVGHGLAAAAGDQYIEVAADLRRRRQGVQGGGLQLVMVVLSDNENTHGLLPYNTWA